MKTCAYCGRTAGDGALSECAYPGSNECRSSTVGLDAAALRRELADAKAEVERLRKLFDDAGHGEHNVLALVDHYIAEGERADDERDAARIEAAELRRLAWEWCIEARYHYAAANDALREVDELRAAQPEPAHPDGPVSTVQTCESCGDVFVSSKPWARFCSDNCRLRAHRAKQRESDLTREEHDAGTELLRALGEPPIESLGPVPLTVNAVETWKHGNGGVLSTESRLVRIERALAYTIRDAVRRGAKLEGSE